MRNLDLTALRAFVTVCETQGVTSAAARLNLTQSAVSMQLKRLEESLDLTLLDRSNRAMVPTAVGQQLLSYALRLLALNDEAYTRLTARDFVGEISLGVPHDILYPAIPQVLRQFNASFPRMKIRLLSSLTKVLHRDFAGGEVDVILTTEDILLPGGETLVERPQVWIGAQGGAAWKQRPLPLAFQKDCNFRSLAVKALDGDNVQWEIVVDTDSSRTVDTSISADLAVHVVVEGTEPPMVEVIDHGGDLPVLPKTQINLYQSPQSTSPAQDALVAMIREGYRNSLPAVVAKDVAEVA